MFIHYRRLSYNKFPKKNNEKTSHESSSVQLAMRHLVEKIFYVPKNFTQFLLYIYFC
mgnify:CR=1 FL=1